METVAVVAEEGDIDEKFPVDLGARSFAFDFDASEEENTPTVLAAVRGLLFSRWEVLMDNEAGRSCVMNAELIDNVTEVEGFSIGGINKDAPALKIAATGSFSGCALGTEHTVAYAPGAAVNVLSWPRLMDQGADLRHTMWEEGGQKRDRY